MGGHSLTGIRKRELPYDRIEERTIEVGEWTGMLDVFDGATNVDRIQSVLTSARIDGKPYRQVIIDHVHLLDVPGGREGYRLALNSALTQLKHLAVEHGVTMVLLAQLRRPANTHQELPRPTKHDLRESGGLGDIADYVLLLHRDEDEGGNALASGVVIVDKVRDGAGSGDIDVTFDTRTYRFREGATFMAGMNTTNRGAA
jgi:replicative DNA helicase